MTNNKEKIRRYVLMSGFLGVLPTAVQFQLYRESGMIFYILLAIISLIISVIFLLKSTDSSWLNRSKVIRYIFLSLFFMGVIPAVPLFLALKYTDKKNNK